MYFNSDDNSNPNAGTWDYTTLVDIGAPESAPEPGILALLSPGLGGIRFARRRKLS